MGNKLYSLQSPVLFLYIKEQTKPASDILCHYYFIALILGEICSKSFAGLTMYGAH